MQTHLFKPLPRRIITASSLGLCLLALPAAAQNFAVPEIARPPVKKSLPPEKTKPQKNLEAENQALKRQLEQARKEADAAKAAKAQEAAVRQKLARDLAKAQAAHVATPPAADSATAAAMAATVAGAAAAAEASAAAKKLPELEGFVLLPGGVARDKKTNLEWMRCSLDQRWDGKTCQGKAKEFKFEQALQAAKDLNAQGGFAGKTNWRVPTVLELFGLVVCNKGIGTYISTVEDQTLKYGCLGGEDYAKPTIAQGVFPNTPEWTFLSSSVNAGNSSGAWLVSFGNGFVNGYGRDNSYHVRLVR